MTTGRFEAAWRRHLRSAQGMILTCYRKRFTRLSGSPCGFASGSVPHDLALPARQPVGRIGEAAWGRVLQ